MSDTAKIAEALARAQGAIQPASKDAENPHFRSRYADLAAVMDACRGPLSANGIAIVQSLTSDATGVSCTTSLLHTSGERLDATLWLPVPQQTPQAYGSAATYARRYGLAALVGIVADEDDDGNAASAPAKAHRPAAQAPKPKPEAPKQSPALRARVAKVWKAVQASGKDAAYFQAWAGRVLGKSVPSADWTEDDVAHVEAALPELLGAAPETAGEATP